MQNFNELITAAQTASAKGQSREALSLAELATREYPQAADGWILSAILHQQAGQLRNARRDYEHAYTLRPDDLQLLQRLFSVLELLGAYADVEILLAEVIEHLPHNDDLLLARANVSAKLGDFETSIAITLQVLQQTPDHVGAIYSLVVQGHGDKVGGIDGIETRLSRAANGTLAHNILSYAHAHLLEQDKRHDEAFAVFARANQQQAVAGGMDMTAKQKGARSVIDDMSPAVIKRFSGHGNPSDRPVFIVGMPRSGTTLTEQILAAHPDVYAAGEQEILPLVLRGLISNSPQSGDSLIESISRTRADVWNQTGTEYLRRVGELNNQAKRVTDKMLLNFALLPYIRLIFPNAHIIHLQREPLASIASCIRTRFASEILGFSVNDWARFYGMYQGLMDHWRPILGAQLLEIDYEELVRDLPTQSRRLVDFLGLEWHEGCLHPESNKRAVRTASIRQVRQSVHTGAIDAWRRYEAQLEPLRPIISESRALLASPSKKPQTQV